MRTGLSVSVIGHGILLALGVVTLASTTPLDMNVEAVPVEFVKVDDVTSLDKGLKTAAIKPDPAPNDPAPAPKEEAKPDPAPPAEKPAPPPPPKAVEAPPEPTPPAPPAPSAPPDPVPPKAAETLPPQPTPPPEPAPDEAKPAEPLKTAMVPPRPRLRPQPPKEKTVELEKAAAKPKPAASQLAEVKDSKFDADKIAALLDKTPAASTPDESNKEAGLGVEKGTANAKMTQNELDALRAAVQRCWVIPQGWTDPREVTVTIRFKLNQDGTVAGTPVVIEFPASQYGQVSADNAIRAVLRCGPYQLPAEKYEQWSEVQLRFTPLG